jgi:uncharacterized Zn-binding protein involved in type VI secretion
MGGVEGTDKMHRLILVLFVTIPAVGRLCCTGESFDEVAHANTRSYNSGDHRRSAWIQPTGQHGLRVAGWPRWRVVLANFACTPVGEQDIYAYETVSLVATDGAAAVVDSQLINCGGLGAYGFDGLFWSADSRYFYYTTAREGVPDGCGDWQPPLRRVNVAANASKDVSGTDPSPDAAALAAWLEQHQVRCPPTP